MIQKTIVFLALAVAIHAQEGGTSTVLDVRLSGKLLPSDCNAIEDVMVVQKGKDEGVPAHRIGTDPCVRRAEGLLRYHTNVNTFSVRIPGIGRSECMKPARWNSATAAGELVYRCCPGGATHELIVTLSDAVPLEYARTYVNSRCTDTGLLDTDPGGAAPGRTLHAVQLKVETVSLKVFDVLPPACGLTVNHLSSVRKARKGDSVRVTRKEAESVLPKCDLIQAQCHAPVLSGGNIELETRQLQFKLLELKVE